MVESDLLLLGVALLLGFVVGGGVVFAVLRRRGRDREPVQAFEVVEDEPARPAPARGEASWEDEAFSVPKPAPRPEPESELARPPVPAMEDSSIPTEWARRQVGPVEPGRAKGVCSGCGTALSISKRRPLRIACPVCGRTRLLA